MQFFPQSQSCLLHLESDIGDLNSECQASVDRFLAKTDSVQGLSAGGTEYGSIGESNSTESFNEDFDVTPRLFIWIQEDESSKKMEVMASTNTFSGENRGVLAFINTSNQPIATRSQIQCITLAPLQLPTDTSANTLDTSNVKSTSTESSINSFHTLQLYTQHAFVPALQALPSNESKILQTLESKMRELDVTLAQCKRSTLSSIPHITLATHSLLETLGNDIPSSGKIDLDELNLSDHLTNDEFLNEIQTIVNSWIPLIQKVTMLPSSQPPPDSDWEEITYWHNLSLALNHIQVELEKPSTLLTLHLLKSAKRFVSTLALENNTHLKSAEEYVNDVNSFLKNYPAEALSSSMTWPGISDSLEDIFVNCVGRIRSSRYYSLGRLIKLVESSLRTAKERMEFLLKDSYKANGILWMEYSKYEKEVYGPTSDLFVQIDVWVTKFKEFVLDLGRKRKISHIGQLINGMNLYHLDLKERLDAIQSFRSEHDKLYFVVHEVLMGEEEESNDGEGGIASGALKEVEDAPMISMGKIDVFDLSEGGKVAFTTALEKYERKIDAIEERLAKLLRDKLTACEVSPFFKIIP